MNVVAEAGNADAPIVFDTNALVFPLVDSPRLTRPARDAARGIDRAR